MSAATKPSASGSQSMMAWGLFCILLFLFPTTPGETCCNTCPQLGKSSFTPHKSHMQQQPHFLEWHY